MRSVPRALVYGLLPALLTMIVAGRAAAAVELTVGPPQGGTEEPVVPVTLAGIFAGDVSVTLEAGLPVSLVFAWQVKRQRAGWWDSRLASGTKVFRIFYDVLEEDYDLFDGAGRRVGTCSDMAAVEEIVCREQLLALTGLPHLTAEHSYYVEVTALLEILGEDELRDLAGWLSGDHQTDAPRDLLSGVSRHTAGLLRELVGLGGRHTRARSPLFHGWD